MDSSDKTINQYIDTGNQHFLRGQYKEALKLYRKVLSLDRNVAVAYYNIANILALESKFNSAERHYKEALKYKPNFPEALNNLGNVLKEQGKLSDAFMSYQEAIKLRGDYFEAYNGLGNVLQAEGRIDEAIAAYKRAIELNPDYHIASSNLLLALNYSSDISPQEIFQEHVKIASSIENRNKYRFAKNNVIKKRDKIKVGYVSPDFRRHSVGYFIIPVFECHNRDIFEVFCYSDVRNQDTFTESIKKASDYFFDCVEMTDEALYSQIRAHEIDILFDLAGHSGYNRLTMFSMRPAPIQITWIGYPNTTGLKTMDYRIVDHYTDPIGMTEFLNSEQLIRMPECFLCYSPPTNPPEVVDAPFKKNGFITFGSLHNLSKINDFTINLWAKSLNIHRDSKMIIKSKTLIDDKVRERFIKRFKERGIDENRLILMPYIKSYKEHLEIYNLIDISLDCFPYNGTTTTFESLLMGVPVVSLAGNSHVSRVGMSILTNLALKEFVAKSEEEFFSVISHLLSRPNHLSNIRNNLRRILMNSNLTNKKNFTNNLEKLLMELLNN